MTKRGKGVGRCQNCGELGKLHKVTARIHPPKGGKICDNCIIPSAMNALKISPSNLHT